jgi:hypothetical protein
MENEPRGVMRQTVARFVRLPAWKKSVLGIVIVIAAVFLAAAVLPLFSRAREAAQKGSVTSSWMQDYYAPEAAGRGMGLNIEMKKADLTAARHAAARARANVLSAQDYDAGLSASPESATTSAAASMGKPATRGGSAAARQAAPTMTGLETWDRQLILTASVVLEVTDVRAAYDRIQSVAAGEGALITQASLQASAGRGKEDREYGHATVVLRTPQSRFYAVRERLHGVASDFGGKVLRDEIDSQDVTEEYVDLKGQIRNWHAQETQLLEIMRQAHRINDILSVRNQLAEVQGEIERLTGRLRFLENRVDLSTITVEIYQKGKIKAPVPPTIASNWHSAGKTIAGAWMRSLRDVVTVLGAIAAALTYVAPFAIILAILWMVARAGRRRMQRPAPATESLPKA